MDFSVKYITMCEKAKEIQETWIPQLGDYYWKGQKFLKIAEAIGIICSDPVREALFGRNGKIWLPKQDQLQAMISVPDRRWNVPNFLAGALNRFIQEKHPRFSTMEQLWLALVMWKKHNKLWDDKKEEWVME